MIKLTTTLALHCDKCGAAYPEVSDKKAGEPDEQTSLEDALQAVMSIAHSCAGLRYRAEAAGWAFAWSSRQDGADLCPSCFTLPPEG